jgi:DNA-directed RNA polymerase subunit alpha
MRDDASSMGNYGRFVVEPFERGFGTTVGNSLRRILLSSLEGAAVTHVRIKGAEHEFTSLGGVLEDVTEIVLNIKGLIVQSTSEHPKSMKLVARGKKGAMTEIRASQIEADAALEVLNKNQLIATLTDAVDLEIEMTVARGRSYVTADEHKAQDEEQIIGVIPVDSVFSPVSRVRYRVEDTRVGQRTNYDRLVMEIWTNGTVSPEMALVEAAKILRKHLNPFVQYFELNEGLAVHGGASESGASGSGAAADDSKMNMQVSVLDLSVRASNCLASANIVTIGDLMKHDEAALLKLRSFGKTSLREVKRKLAEQGLTLKSSGIDDSGEDDEADEEPIAATGAVRPPSIAPLDSGTMIHPPASGSQGGLSSAESYSSGSQSWEKRD